MKFIFCARVEEVMHEALGLDVSPQFKVAS
jgi:hypothetical protein